ncbi:MAG: hypothetical protein ACLPZ0_21630 [Steroidobacteraceae bacterium]
MQQQRRAVTFRRLKLPSRRALFWAGLSLLVVAFVGSLIVAYRQELTAPMTAAMAFPGPRKERLRNIQIVLTGQLPREPEFEGKIFIGLEDTPIEVDHLTLHRDAVGAYAPSELRLDLLKDNAFGVHTNPADMDFPAADRGHSRFPFDSSNLDLKISFQPAVPIEVIRITNRVPGFILSKWTADRSADGSIRLRFSLDRNLFTQILCGLILFAGFCFALLILGTQTASALGSSVAAFFFSLWSLRGVLATQIQTFPTLFDYAIVLLCSFMLLGLIWRVATHPELMGKASR